MSINSSRMARPGRIGMFVVAALIFLVPPLVLATSTGSKSTPVRLSRGFGPPRVKCNVTPPAEEALESASSSEAPEPPRVSQNVPSHDESIPDSPYHASPDAQRGPPRIELF